MVTTVGVRPRPKVVGLSPEGASGPHLGAFWVHQGLPVAIWRG